MLCLKCKCKISYVIDTRTINNGTIIKRRRKCKKCKYKFTTFERLEMIPILILKKNGIYEKFNRNKILNGLLRAFKKRPISMKQILNIIDEIEYKIISFYKKNISTKIIGEYIISVLIKLDKIAYIRYLSVYKQFKNIDVFLNEFKKIIKY